MLLFLVCLAYIYRLAGRKKKKKKAGPEKHWEKGGCDLLTL